MRERLGLRCECAGARGVVKKGRTGKVPGQSVKGRQEAGRVLIRALSAASCKILFNQSIMGTYCCDMARNPDACSRIIAIHRSTHMLPRHSTHIHPRHHRHYWNRLERIGIRASLPSLSLSIPAPCPFFILFPELS